ncbi:olfactomedin-4-like [Spea bombifrons]|uniref:olfactomedin-4-like n=1 Tax=Spea bombifrons TaxID=233779 RepID=UPI00234BCA1C|nr:olfactomedin-4-like [Spea bombifrons]
MILLLLLLAAPYTRSASLEVNSTGSLDERGVCQCSIALPDNTFPADRLESLEIYNQNLSISVQAEITKIQSYQETLTAYVLRLKNLTMRVEVMEMGGISYTELDFELLKLEIREMESLVTQLRASIDGSNVLVESLFVEIRNISIMVNQLESYDKNNVLAVRREIAALRKRLEDCEKNQEIPTQPPHDYGTCKHGGIVNISKPFVVQLNYLGFSYKFGGWGKDSMSGANQDVHWVAPLTTDGRMMNVLRFYPSYDDLLLYKKPTEKVLTKNLPYNTFDYSICGQGGGAIMFNNSMYYNCYNTRDLCKFNVETNAVERTTLTDATFNNRFSYASSAWQDIDLASDEDGLWVIYSTEQNSGNMVISKLNSTALTVEKTWVTSQYKLGVTNAFMVCGVLYATRTINTRREEIFYMYDTKTSTEGRLSIYLDKMMENVQSLSYNPNDHKLYMYNDGYLVNYNLVFKQLPSK